jgi:hypothetical protein
MTQAADHVRMPDTIESYGFVLEVLYQRSLEVGVEVVLHEDIQGLYDDLGVRRLRRSEPVRYDEYLGIAAASEPPYYVVSAVDSAVVESKFPHRIRQQTLRYHSE